MNYTSYYHPSSFCKFLIDDASKFAHLYSNQLANHLPMSLVALDAMGAQPKLSFDPSRSIIKKDSKGERLKLSIL